MIDFTVGNLLESKADCLINTVNCEGFMGKGIAYQFKMQFPNNNEYYINSCKLQTLKIGKLNYFYENDKIIINFPTKDKWRQKSKIEYIELGLNELILLIPKLKIKSIAIPSLGCGNGGLEWNIVKKLIIEKLSPLAQDYDFIIYEPSYSYKSSPQKPPKLNISSLILMNIKFNLNEFNSTRLQKTAYFLNYFLNEEYFKFKKHKYGPYNNTLTTISKNIKEFQTYYNMKSTEEAYDLAYKNLISDKTIKKLNHINPAILKATEYVNKIENDKDLECISTIMFLFDLNNNFIEDDNEIIKLFRSWSKDKSNRFSDDEIISGINYLKNTNILKNTLLGYEISN